MSKDHWDAIFASAPLNATAGRVTSKGYAYTPDKVITSPEWDAPPPLKPIQRKHRMNPSFTDFTGMRFGRLVVLGMGADSHDPGESRGALWICRCACGRYVGRRGKALKSPKPDASCQLCQHTAYLRHSASGNNARARAESDKARKW